MAAVGLLTVDPELAEVLASALADEGHSAERLVLSSDITRRLARRVVQVLVLDGHEYVNTKQLLAAVRAQRATETLPIVVLGPARPHEVPDFPGVAKLGPLFDLHAVLDAVNAALRAEPGGS